VTLLSSPNCIDLLITCFAAVCLRVVLNGTSRASRDCAAIDTDSHSWEVANPKLKVKEYAAMDTLPNAAAAEAVQEYATILAMVRKSTRLPALAYDFTATVRADDLASFPSIEKGMDL